ncbi:MAG: hypothetical protein ACI4KA_10520 [Oscillospiraceae bacterium]
MTKNYTVYYIVLAVLVIAAVALAEIIVLSVLITAVIVWWSVYYYTISYKHQDNLLYVNSGVLFRHRREISESKILWITYLYTPASHRAFASILHTAGGWIVIFNEFSTKR